MNILIVVSGGIAAFKSAQLVSDLVKLKHNVKVVMTKNATNFITPLTLATLSKNQVYVDMFDINQDYSSVLHIELSKWADVVVVVPATANIISKISNGLADDLASTTILAALNKPIIIMPAMNSLMLSNPSTVDNLATLIKRGYYVMDSDCGLLACGDYGKGKLPPISKMIEFIEMVAYPDKPLLNKTVLISAGPTIEAIDPVRFISNHSTGKMGYSLAKMAARLGAKVILVSGKTNLEKPLNCEFIQVISADEMYNCLCNKVLESDYVIMAAAVADFKPAFVAKHKIKKEQKHIMQLELINTLDIISELVKIKPKDCKICGFAMESENLIENGKSKLLNKNMDMIVCNNILDQGAGFGYDTNIITIIDKVSKTEFSLMSKDECALEILKHLVNLEV